MKTFSIVSLGCPRNLVDSEVMAGSLRKSGFRMAGAEKDVEVCVVNTCAFIGSAREESVDAIVEAAGRKKEGKIKHLVIAGCLPQFYKNKLLKTLPEVDLIIGTSDFPRIAGLISALKKGAARSAVSNHLDYLYNEDSPRFSFTPRHYKYVKISEGCSNFCSYCVISRLRGPFRSRTIQSVLGEVRKLSKGGAVKEIELIGQDTTLFGIDQYGKSALQYLLADICGLTGSPRWVRLLYTHPAHYTDELIATIAGEEKVCKYLDLPVQHISDTILRKMNRRTAKRDIVELIARVRKKIPALTLRTSVIVGFPGESEKDFKELLDFVRRTRFERLGAFIYSREEGTKAHGFEGQVPESVKKERFDEVMKLQQRISGEINKSFLGKIVEVLIDEKTPGETGSCIGRTQGDAPEIDGVVYVAGQGVKVGEFRKVKITDTLEYDLAGEAV